MPWFPAQITELEMCLSTETFTLDGSQMPSCLLHLSSSLILCPWKQASEWLGSWSWWTGGCLDTPSSRLSGFFFFFACVNFFTCKVTVSMYLGCLHDKSEVKDSRDYENACLASHCCGLGWEVVPSLRRSNISGCGNHSYKHLFTNEETFSVRRRSVIKKLRSFWAQRCLPDMKKLSGFLLFLLLPSLLPTCRSWRQIPL